MAEPRHTRPDLDAELETLRTRLARLEEEHRGVKRHYEALQQSEEGVKVSVPGLPGCWSQGADEEEAISNIHEGIREYLSVRDELLKNATVREIDVTV